MTWVRRRHPIGVVFVILLVMAGVCFYNLSSFLQVVMCMKPLKWPTGNLSLMTMTVEASPNITLPCKWKPDDLIKPTRPKAIIRCDHPLSGNMLSFETVHTHSSPHSVNTISTNQTWCLHAVIHKHCDVKQRVPRVAHYVRFGQYNLSLDCFISVLSVARFFQPCLIVFHSDVEPEGPYWEALLSLIPNIVRVHMDRPQSIYGHSINVVEHSADIARLRILLEYGGIYLDIDHLVLSPLQDLLNESVVIGTEKPKLSCGNGFLIAEPNAPFLQLWLSSYTSFEDKVWGHHSTRMPYILSQKFPQMVRIVDTFFKPDWSNINKLFNKRSLMKIDWKRYYGMHVYTRVVKGAFYGPVRIDQQDNIMGDIVRYILFGDEHACR